MGLLHEEYDQYLRHDTDRLTRIKKNLRSLVLLRLFSFTAIALSLILLMRVSPLLAWISAVGFLMLFLYAIKVFFKREKEKELYSRLIGINNNEKLALDETFDQFADGTEFTDPHHPFSFDLDLFGTGSLFQYLNRTVLAGGKEKLAGSLSDISTDARTIEERQEAINELSALTRWRQYFAAHGSGRHGQELTFTRHANEPVLLKNPSLFKWNFIIFPAACIFVLLMCSWSLFPWSVFFLFYTVNILILLIHRKKTEAFYQVFGKQTKILDNYLELLRLTETKVFQSPLLKQIQAPLLEQGQKASDITGRLQKIVSRFEYRSNVLFIVTGEFIFLHDLICTYQLDRWQRKYGTHIIHWLNALNELDALSSLANMNHNHPEWTLPVINRNDFCIAANELAHPLIPSVKRIGNDFRMNGKGQLVILTGANMAGKSTFLRTLGINMILAMNGCRVCASSMTLKPTGLFTNMRTTDNLRKEESYFFAELHRLQRMLQVLEGGSPVFMIIDEMLKGTNSKDKLEGSTALIKKIIRLNGNAIVATHDLHLTELAPKFPANIVNMCFNVDLSSGKLLFDYKLRKGVTHTMNAGFLMKKMGITD